LRVRAATPTREPSRPGGPWRPSSSRRAGREGERQAVPGEAIAGGDRAHGGRLMGDMRYSARIVWSEEDGGYVATVPELEGLSAFGETQEDALTELGTARALWVEESCASENDMPTPLTLPTYSGQFRVRLPRSLH